MNGDKLTVENAESSQEGTFDCIAPDEGRLVYDFFNDILPEEKARRFESHLLLCFRCQEIIFALDQAFELLSQNQNELFQVQDHETEDRKSRGVSTNSSK